MIPTETIEEDAALVVALNFLWSVAWSGDLCVWVVLVFVRDRFVVVFVVVCGIA